MQDEDRKAFEEYWTACSIAGGEYRLAETTWQAALDYARGEKKAKSEMGLGVYIAIDALHELARLGNEPHYGTSRGNQIAIRTLRHMGAECQDEGCPQYGKPHSHKIKGQSDE